MPDKPASDPLSKGAGFDGQAAGICPLSKPQPPTLIAAAAEVQWAATWGNLCLSMKKFA
ncbi:hypothetical protein GGD46_001856 [Rhizobium lusitanum]|uniref:Uncharacterized protein n=1 Tax=Rhizobium lusitanum TaxID=293958 RepID=A0A7X0IP54_9HYPH|nr:hypothetical protein [Rhizobium lusitanum]